MTFKFVIPLRSSELQSANKNSYFVTRVSAPTEIPGLLKNAKLDFRQNGPSFIIDHFDTFYSVFENNDCPMSTSVRAFDFLYEVIDKLCREIGADLNNPQLSDSDRLNLANITKMCIYLLVNIVKVIDTQLNNSANDIGKSNKKVIQNHDQPTITV
uniref:CSON000624 protein n=1 Tax=Culicoides sonorensis TaxID=179676 RepID=A0A336LPZ6_CULSO